jgi:trans-aconitate methyltransferase
MTKTIYDSAFYSTYESDSIESAREILTIVKTLVNPKSVVDVGCGIGTWLKVWRDFGVYEITGIDGDYVIRENLLIPPERFKAMDLTAPGDPVARFDLVQSLEVAEHLPAESAESFISFLCCLGPVVLFSAAIPYQGGTDHINEQWPEYWAALFKKHSYVTVDAIRDRVWTNPKVAYYYAQNALLFVHVDHVDRLNLHCRTPPVPSSAALSRVHPKRWEENHERPPRLEQIAKALPRSSYDFAYRSFRKLTTLMR